MGDIGNNKVTLEDVENAELDAMIALEDGNINHKDYITLVEYLKTIKSEMEKA